MNAKRIITPHFFLDVLRVTRCLNKYAREKDANTIRMKDKLSPIFMISAYNKPDQIVEGLQSGADDYITKPFDSEVLLLKIKAILIIFLH